MISRKIFFLLFIVAFIQNAFSQQQYFFTNYTVDDGLSNNAIRCIIKDSEGFLWAGTIAGLNRFNGYDFTVYKSIANDTTTIPSNVINGLFVDHEGQLWISTFGGVCVYEKNKNQFRRISFRMKDGSKLYAIECSGVFEDSKKNIWVTTIGFSVFKYDKKQNCFAEVTSRQTLHSKNQVNSVIEISDGTFWHTSYSHLFHFNPADNSYEEFENRISDEDHTFQAMKVFADAGNENYLWIATWGSGLVQFNKQSKQFISYKFEQGVPSNLGNIVFQIHRYDKNKLWLATNKGIVIFDENEKKFEGVIRDSLNEKPVINIQALCVYRDDEGITWIGTVSGLCNIHPAKQYFISNPIWSNAPVPKFYYDEAEEKIYGLRFYLQRSLYVYDRKLKAQTIYKIPDADELRAEPFSVIKDNNGLLWIGTTKGIYTFDESKKKFELFNIESKLKILNRSLYCGYVFKDSKGNLWFSCYSKGLLMIDVKNNTVKAYFNDGKEKNSFPVVAINGIAEGKENLIYVCDDSHGIVMIDCKKETWKYFSTKEKKYSVLADATDLTLDKEERIWVTTKNNGLVCIDKNLEVTTYLKDDFGNLIDEQQSIVIDNSGKIWLTANNGIYSFNPESKAFTHFTMQDGLPVRTLPQPLVKLNDGSIAYSFHKGIFKFYPEELSKKEKPLDVHLTSLLVNGKTSSLSNIIDKVDTIRLNHRESNLTFEFAAINFTNASSTVYSYFLEGNDRNWSVPTRTRVLNFSQLAPGDYSLLIRAGISGTNNNSPVKKIFIKIIPAWWQTSWFRWLILFAGIFILVFSIRFVLSFRYKQKIAQLEKQREIENIRMRISRDIHDEIGSGLTKIKLMSRNLSKKTEDTVALKETSSKISIASDELIQNLGEIVWTINPVNDTLENIFAFMRNYLSKLFDENTDVKLQLDFPDPSEIPHRIFINPEVKRNLLLILKEAVTNIFKHAQATEVSISMRAGKSKIELIIRDNGRGIKTENQNGFGNGLKNMRRRAESINANFVIESSPETGTNVHLLIPLSQF